LRGRETAALSGHGRERIMVRVEDIREAAEAEPGFALPAGAIGVTVSNMSAKVPGVTWVMSAMSAGTARAAMVVLLAGKQYRGSEKLVVESARSQFPPDTAIPMPAPAVPVNVAAAATAARRTKRRRGGEERRLGGAEDDH